MSFRLRRTLDINLKLVILVSAILSPAHADREIVYGARYYAPPHSNIQTHFHLYRINPDGTGKTQLTFGSHDDTEPFWAPDGQSIVFFRNDQFSIVSARGGTVMSLPVKIDYATRGDLHWSPDGRTLAVATGDGTRPMVYLIDTHTRTIRSLPGTTDYQWSPDGTKRYIQNVGNSAQIVGPVGKAQITLAKSEYYLGYITWINNDTLFGIRTTDDKPIPFIYNIAAKRETPVPFKLTPQASHDTEDDFQADPVYLLPIPNSTQNLLYAWNQHDSTVGINNDFYRVNIQTGLMTLITQGKQFVTFSPDGSRFCTAPGRDTSNYEKRGITFRTVWTAPLQIGELKTGHVHTISQGFVWVKGADWRKPPRKKFP